MLEFESDGIKIFLQYTRKNGFTYYEDTKKPTNESTIKPIVTDKRINSYKKKDVSYFKKIYESDDCLNMKMRDGYIYV
ncbi:hypothetical protein [Virgibacillus sp. DJP39]|uniref:hypothetical protein n=1 Tax=Virgibacillus sp. DJP39 TaxID=3409790 RepID=UPI003BB55734